ncbi:hypothetical protein C9J48_23915 [Photobacterium profundum]|uniref:Methylamine utilization protein MauE n=1 Tax=Photobacterium profundum 3TCK TaxID=314280 RepID=Q1Z974_9GAMM|nr:MauE/DoxX family redox-associated membrane protein [Photobacterium profundum]EAS44884.1 hypothetical protein P3TCK_20410 [Photobacterium profundum 3TCK]PSV59476.1 hypothetical protein C9J48_23915 [Photobacterium profundum]
MKTKGYVHRFITCYVFFMVAAIALKGFFMPEHTGVLLIDTGLISAMYVEPITFAFPFALTVCALLAYVDIVSLKPTIFCLALYTFLAGLAIQQGLNLDCNCYVAGSLESAVYRELEPQFYILLLVIIVTSALHIFNTRHSTQNQPYMV